MDYTMDDLHKWNEIIEKKAQEFGLDYYPQQFDICDFEEMIGYETYIGMPSHYPHWSFGKSYDRTKTMHKKNLTGLPYEMVINSNPCLAYLMKDNTLLLQILTIAHVYGHNDFFKNNRLFATGTDASLTIETFKNHADRIRDYISDPSIGYEKVEKILDAAHSLKYQRSRVVGEKVLSEKEKRQRKFEEYQTQNLRSPDFPHLIPAGVPPIFDGYKIPVEPMDDLLGFIVEYGRLEEWQRDIVSIVRKETSYFMPQIETKIMNEGWASYWHYNILNSIDLPQGLHIEFLKRHNQVIRPHTGQINPYYVGFKIFEWIDKNMEDGRKKIFFARNALRDSSFIKQYLNRELCEEMNLFEYQKSKSAYSQSKQYKISQVSDEDGWKVIRDSLADSTGASFIPNITIDLFDKGANKLYLSHEWDGRDLNLEYTSETLKYIYDLWPTEIVFNSTFDGSKYNVICKDRITSLNNV